MGFLNSDFILVASKLVFTKVFWRFENVPQLKFKNFQGLKWMKENFKDFQGLVLENSLVSKGFQDEPYRNFDNLITSF